MAKTIRDEMAMAALPKAIDAYLKRGKGNTWSQDAIDSFMHGSSKKPHREISKVAYKVADAMLEERKKKV